MFYPKITANANLASNGDLSSRVFGIEQVSVKCLPVVRKVHADSLVEMVGVDSDFHKDIEGFDRSLVHWDCKWANQFFFLNSKSYLDTETAMTVMNKHIAS